MGKRIRRVGVFALPLAAAAVVLLCLPGGASASKLDTEALTINVTGNGTITGTGGINCRANFVAHSIRPASGLDALAYSRFGIRPARKALRPAITPPFIASAISTGFLA